MLTAESTPATSARTRPDPATTPAQRGATDSRGGATGAAPALLCGDLNLLRCFLDGEVRTCVVATDPAEPTLRSRHCRAQRLIADPREAPAQALADLLALAQEFPERPVLFYGDDAMLRLVSRNRGQLTARFRFLMPSAELIEDLADKERFVVLARRLDLPAPRSFTAAELPDADAALAQLGLPCILKPASHTGWLAAQARRGDSGPPRKVLRAETPDELRACYQRLRDFTGSFVIQQYIPGSDDNIYSFHCYVARDGALLGGYVGRKIRTYPRDAGISTYLELVHEPEVERLGVEVVTKVQLIGPAKLDFKRDPRDGRFSLLEINPRFTLWNHLGAACGVNLPRIAYDDLIGRPPRPRPSYRSGVRWLSFANDLRGFVREYHRSGDLSVADYLRSLRGRKVYDVFAWDDPAPLLVSLASYGRALGARLWQARRR